MLDENPNRDCILDAFNPQDGQIWQFFIKQSSIEAKRTLGIGRARELAFLVPETLRRPKAIFRGLRDRAEANLGLCYASCPSYAYDYRTGQREVGYPDEVFLVFVNSDRVVYNWRWEKADPKFPTLPLDHATRFDERLR